MTALFSATPLGWWLWFIFFFFALLIGLLRSMPLRVRMIGFILSVGSFVLGITSKAYVYLQNNDTIATVYSHTDQTAPLYQFVFIVSTALLLFSMSDILFMLLSIMSGRGGGLKE